MVAKIEIVHIPYKIGAQGITDTIGGQVPFNISNFPAMVAPVQTGRLRALAVTSANRAAQLSSVPTMQEAGYPRGDCTLGAGDQGRQNPATVMRHRTAAVRITS